MEPAITSTKMEDIRSRFEIQFHKFVRSRNIQGNFTITATPIINAPEEDGILRERFKLIITRQGNKAATIEIINIIQNDLGMRNLVISDKSFYPLSNDITNIIEVILKDYDQNL
jgi:hypothetical protein